MTEIILLGRALMIDAILLIAIPAALIYCALSIFRAWLEYRRER